MLVKDYMTRHPIMIEPHKRILEAQQIMVENDIHHLPVVGDGKRLEGLLTTESLNINPEKLGSLNVWEITSYLAGLTVKQVMLKGKDLHTIPPSATLEEAAASMITHSVDSLPVVDDRVVVGIITKTDLLVELQNLLGANDPGWRVTVRVPDRPGEFVKLTSAISDQGWGIMTLGSVRAPKKSTHWEIVLKVRGCTQDELASLLNQMPDHQLIDLRETSVYTD